jgi:hypothetical protein
VAIEVQVLVEEMDSEIEAFGVGGLAQLIE